MDYEKLILRPGQKSILGYTGGWMGVSAVPGSGKTWTLSLLAADLLSRGIINDDQEILIVTLVNSAVNNFYQRISAFIEQRKLVPNLGYRVRTLHGLANDIVRERPELLGLDTNYQIIDEYEASEIRNDIAYNWLKLNYSNFQRYLDNNSLEENQLEWIKREHLPELIQDIAHNVIRFVKDLRISPDQLNEKINKLELPIPLARMGCELYQNYQRALTYRGAVDFDDLVRFALDALEWDDRLRQRLQYRWQFILEDEAQDSSALQEQILRTIVGHHGNWVRVGDPNQAIYETFTTANPRYLRSFINEANVIQCELPNSGRSTLSILKLANNLVDWTQSEHPLAEVRNALKAPPYIEPVPSDDPQPNPPDEPENIHIILRKYTPAQEIIAVVKSIEKWLTNHSDQTIAVLTPRNQRAFELTDELQKHRIPYNDSLLRSSSSTRESAMKLCNVIRYLSDPQSAVKLANAFREWANTLKTINENNSPNIDFIAESIRKLRRVEDYLNPGPEYDWLETLLGSAVDPRTYELLSRFRQIAQRWQEAVLLPVDQLILMLAQDLLTNVNDLALAHKLAMILRRARDLHPEWSLPDISGELSIIARNERRFLGFSDDDTGFDPDQFPGLVVVSTIHKAKGLEWDRVYLMSTNNYDYPSAQPNDQFIAEKWFIRDRLNLSAETLEQLKVALLPNKDHWYREGEATINARYDYVMERLRLLYVGITRARKNLIITWNTGRKGDLLPALPLVALSNY
jgi:DNA helicase-2/ATP-dependent DNA helicase PcrA